MFVSFIRYIFPTLALSKSGFRVETESRLLSAGFHQLPVSNIKVVLVLLCIRTGENARENSETVVSGRKIRRNFSVLDLSFSVCDLRNVPIRIILIMDLIIVLQTLPGKPFQLVGLAANTCSFKNSHIYFYSFLLHKY